MANQVPLTGSALPRHIWPYSIPPHNGYIGAMAGVAHNDGVNDNAKHMFGPGIGRFTDGGSSGVAGGGDTPGVQQFAFTIVPR